MSTQVAGVLKDPFERPLANTAIDIRAINNNFAILPGPTVSIRTNAQGEYNFILEPASYAISVIIDGRSVYQGAVTVTSTTPPATLPELLKQAEMEFEIPLNYGEYFRQVQETVKDDAQRAQDAADSIGDELQQAQAAAAASAQSASAAEQSNQGSQQAYQKTKVIADKFSNLDDAVTQTQQNAAKTNADAQQTAADRQASEDAAKRAEDAADSAETVNERNVRVPQGEVINTLPDAQSRKNTLPIFDNDGQQSVIPLSRLAQLDDNGKIPVNEIPAIALNENFVASSQAEMLALRAEQGDTVNRTDLNQTLVLKNGDPTKVENWIPLLQNPVLSVAGKKGDVVLSPSDIVLSSAYGGSTLDRLIQSATPEQYGAIGDGVLHPLSERYATLDAAKADYPFVTALTQSIDWAACQRAENECRGIRPIRCPYYAKYHLGNDYLKLGERSKWYGNDMPSLDRPCTTFIREGNSGSFGQNCIVRVMTATEAGSSDEFVRGIVFKGFLLTRKRARRYNSKYEGSIGFHADHAIGMQVNVSVSGCEYGFIGYVCWNLSGSIRVDSCHKSIWLDPATATPEYTPAAGAAMTALDLKVEVDACVFGPVLRRCKYGQIHGWVEGMIVNPSVYPIYDTANETAIAITTYNCDSLDITQLGIEAWQGVHHYNYGSTVSVNQSWTSDYKIVNSTGKNGPYHAMSVLMGNAQLFTLPATANSMFYNLSVGALTVRNLSGDLSGSQWSDVYFLTTDQNSRTVFENCQVYFGGNSARFAPGWMGTVEPVGGRYIVDAITPTGYTRIGVNTYIQTSWADKAISGGDGRVQLAIGSDLPAGCKINTVDAFVVSTTTTAGMNVGVLSASDTVIQFQTNNTAGASLRYKATISRTS